MFVETPWIDYFLSLNTCYVKLSRLSKSEYTRKFKEYFRKFDIAPMIWTYFPSSCFFWINQTQNHQPQTLHSHSPRALQNVDVGNFHQQSVLLDEKTAFSRTGRHAVMTFHEYFTQKYVTQHFFKALFCPSTVVIWIMPGLALHTKISWHPGRAGRHLVCFSCCRHFGITILKQAAVRLVPR